MTGYLNKHFRFVFSPKNKDRFNKRPRFLIGAGSLVSYLGERNAETVQKAALKSKTDKVTVKFRKCGKIEIYTK